LSRRWQSQRRAKTARSLTLTLELAIRDRKGPTEMSPRRIQNRLSTFFLLGLIALSSISHAAGDEAGAVSSGAAEQDNKYRVVQGAFIGAGLALLTTGLLLGDAIGADHRYFTDDSGDRIEIDIEPGTDSKGFYIAGSLALALGLIYEILPSGGTGANEHASIAAESESVGIKITSVALDETNAGIAFVGGF
jgi:hypothetical protein